MMNFTIFNQTMKSNLKLWLIFTVIMSVVLAVMIAVFEPSTISGVTDLVKDTPLAEMLGNTTFIGMMGSTFYSLHGILLPVIYILMTANSLIAQQVDRGSMAYLLSTPTKRSTIVRTQASYLITATVVMLVIMTAVGVFAIQVFQSEASDSIPEFLLMNLGLGLLMFATSSISFFFSCLFNLSKNSLALGAGIPIAFFLFQLMAQVSDSLEVLKYFTINTFFDVDAIIAGDSVLIPFFVLFLIGIILYPLSMIVFQRKDLPL